MTEKRLDRANVEDMLALTPTQEGLLFHYASGRHQQEYVQQLTVRFTGECRMDLLQAAWEEVIRRNEMLRTVYRYEKLERPVQIVLKQAETPIRIVDLSGMQDMGREDAIRAERERERRQLPDLETAPLRVTLCKLADGEGEMIVTWHHILFDGWSNGILLKELLQAYRALTAGAVSQEQAGKTRFKEFVRWHQSLDREAHRQYWQRELADWTERTAIPEQASDAVEHATGEPCRRKLPQAEAEAMAQLAQSREVTLAALLYGAWGLLLYRYSRSNDVVFGTTVSGRVPHIHGIEEMVGLFINTIPLRISCGPDMPVEQYIRLVNEGLKRREEYEHTALVDIASYSGFNQSEPLFDTIVVLENYPLDKRLMQDELLKIEQYEMTEATHYGITVGIQIFEGIELEIAYDADRYSKSFIERMAGHYCRIIRAMTENPERPIGMIGMITEEERAEILHGFNREIVPADSREAVHRLFERQAFATPDRTAVLCGGRELTYGELNERADRIAGELRRRGAAAGDHVAILLERDEQLIAAILGVLKSGAAYVPIDTEYAPERIAQTLEDSDAKLLISGLGDAERYGYRDRWLNLSEVSAHAPEDCMTLSAQEAGDAAYILYTSGSTGRPKGVVVEHGNLLAYVQAFQHEFKLTEADSFLQQASCSFDQFVEEMYPILLAGGKLVIAGKMDVLDLDRLGRLIHDSGVTVVSCSPLLLNELNKQASWKGVRIFISGGDVLKPEYYANLLAGAAVYNTYGPTEATVCATYHRCLPGVQGSVPIGKPIWNYRVYVLNAADQLQPVGIPGEICIGGEGVARGYLNRPELTAKSFMQDPFRNGGRLYRTGDVGRWLPDGSIQFLGRADEQIKIRGYRVEPGDVEHHLLSHPSINDAIVLTVDDAYGQKALAAYIHTEETELYAEEIREYLEGRLPLYMVPSHMYTIPEVPRTANGKTDKKALSSISQPLARRSRDDAAMSETETKIRRAWQEVLKLEDVSLHDHFFDLGGNSILLMQLHGKLEKEHGWGLGIVDLFTYSTIHKLARWIESRNTAYDESVFGGYQTLPDRFFARNPQASGSGSVRYHVQGELYRNLHSIAGEHKIAAADVLSSVFAYLFGVKSGKNEAMIQMLMDDGEQASPWQVKLDAISGFPDLFASITELRAAVDSSRYPYRNVLEISAAKGDLEILPLIGRGELQADAALLEMYELVIAVEDEEAAGQLTVHMKFNDRRLRKEAIQELAGQSVEVLGQLAESRILS